MAGTFVTFVNPGYSTLFTRDYSYSTVALVDGSNANVFDPDASNPLQEGEWLRMSGTTGSQGKVERACANIAYTGTAGSVLAEQTSGTALELSTEPCFMHFAERGRYDSQVTRKAHCVIGPAPMQFRTKMIVCANDAARVGERVYVTCCIDASGRNVAALISETDSSVTVTSGHWSAGVILHVHGENDCTVLFQPSYA